VLAAVSKIPAFERALDKLRTRALRQLRRDWEKIPLGGKGALVATSLSIAGSALTAAVLDDDTRDFLLEQLDGRDVPVPVVKGLRLNFKTRGKNVGVLVTLDLAPLMPTF
jgi:hypothetical protein